jgi:hypothetical protein
MDQHDTQNASNCEIHGDITTLHGEIIVDQGEIRLQVKVETKYLDPVFTFHYDGWSLVIGTN